MFSWFKIDPKKELQRVLGDYTLPSFPALVMEALQALRDPDSALADIADLISRDPGLSVSVLRTANSAAYSLRNPVTNVARAVTLCGRTEIESLLLSVAVRDTLPNPKKQADVLSSFWNTCARRAVVARALAQKLHPTLQSEAFTAGLLQDMGIPVLYQVYGDDYEKLLVRAHGQEDELVSLERGHYDWDHAEVATWMCAQWEFPERIASAIGAHHGRDEANLTPLDAVSLVSTLDATGSDDTFLAAAEGASITDAQAILDACQTDAEELARIFASP